MTEKVILDVEGITLVGELHLPEGKGPFPAVCICHGIPSGQPKDPGDGGYPELAEKICREGFAAFIFNFRGAGESGGNFDLVGWESDLTAAIDYLWALPGLDRTHLSLLGYSGGAAVSICVAARDKRMSGVAACACPAEFTFLSDVDEPQKVVDYFRSIGVIRDDDFPESTEAWLGGFDRVRPIDCVGRISPRRLLLVHGNKDDSVDISHAHRLYERAGEPKQLVVIDGVGHRLRREERTVRQVIGWLEKYGRASGRAN
jgi:alpha/beta superfamily hydrolase